MTYEHRLERLERENRWMKRAGAVGIALAAVVLVMGQAKAEPRVIEAEAFVVRDGEGKQRAVLSMEKPNTPSLVLFDKNGTKRVYLLAEQGGRASLGLGPEDGEIRTVLRVNTGGDAALNFFDANGKRGSQFGIDMLDQPSLYLMTEDRNQVILEATRDMARLSFSEPGQRPRVSVGIASGRIIWNEPTD